jgi:hypothetical protein
MNGNLPVLMTREYPFPEFDDALLNAFPVMQQPNSLVLASNFSYL